MKHPLYRHQSELMALNDGKGPDLDKVAKSLETIVGEPVIGVSTSHGVTLLLMWHEAWQALKSPRLESLEAVLLNTELLQIGRIMQACKIISDRAIAHLNYAVYSLTDHHIRDKRKGKKGDLVIELHLQNDRQCIEYAPSYN